MKRVFCNTCQKVRRFRNLPYNASPVTTADAAFGYIGDCDRHSSTLRTISAANRNNRTPKKQVVRNAKPVTVNTSSRKGRK